MIRCFLNKEITSSVCVQLAGFLSPTKRFISNDPSLGPAPEFLPSLSKKDRVEREKAFKAFQNAYITPINRAHFLPSEQLPRKKTQMEAKSDSNENQKKESTPLDKRTKEILIKESECAEKDLNLWYNKYKHLSSYEGTIRKVCAVIEER